MHVLLFLPVLLMWATDARPAPARRDSAVRTVSACAAVTRADVERALGRSFGNGKEQMEGADSTCDYSAGKGQVTVTVQRLKASPDMAVEIASLKAELPESRVRAAAGIGTTALFLDIPDAGTQLHVIRGEHDYLMVSILGFGDPAQVSSAAETLARKALERF